MNFSQDHQSDNSPKHERSSSEIIFEGSTLAQYMQEQEDTSELNNFSEQTNFFSNFQDKGNEVINEDSDIPEQAKKSKFDPKVIYSTIFNRLTTVNFTDISKDLLSAKTQINNEFFNLIDHSIEKFEIYGWLNSAESTWRFKTNTINFETNCITRPKTLNLLPMKHRYYLGGILILVIGLLIQFRFTSSILNCFLTFSILILTIRFYNLNFWYNQLTIFTTNLNQYSQIYLELDKDFKSIIGLVQEIELVSKGYRSGIRHGYSSSSIDEEGREMLMDGIKNLQDAYFKCQISLIKEFDLPYTKVELQNLQNLSIPNNNSNEESTWLHRVKLEYEKLYTTRKTLLNMMFNLIKFKLANIKSFLKLFNQNFNQLSLIGNGIKIQLKEVFNINSSPNTSLSSSSFDSSLLRHHRKKSSLLSTSSTDEDQTSALIKLNKSLNGLELEMRTWFAKFHVINTSIANISQSTTLKNDPEETHKAIEGVINEFKQMTQSVSVLTDASKRSENLLKEWSESFSTSPNTLSPSLTLIEEEVGNISPLVDPILELNEKCEVFDCESEEVNNNLKNLLTTQPECFEIEALPPITPPELVKTKLTREERIKQNREKRKSEQCSSKNRPNVSSIVQELNTAIRSHQLKMETFRAKPQRPKSMPPSGDSSANGNLNIDNSETNLRPNTPASFEFEVPSVTV